MHRRQLCWAHLNRDILKRDQALFTFVHEEGVESTNNIAERSLRHAVIWPKGSFGTWSADGRAFVSRILTVGTTLHQQGRPASLLPHPASSRA